MPHGVKTHVIPGIRFALLAIIATSIVACGSQRQGTDHAAALVTGKVAAGPISPGARPSAPATRAVRGATVDALHGTQVIATARTDEAGRYELRLQPGTYVIRARSDKYLAKETSKTVTLARGQELTVNLVFATGIS